MRNSPHPVARVAVRTMAAPSAGTARMAELWRRLVKELFDPYRPEWRYMRGPGPKWRERHGAPRRRARHDPS